METNEVLIAAFENLRARVKPAVLDSDYLPNGRVMRAYLDSKGFDWANADAETLAAGLYEATNAEAAKLRWLVKPAKLTKFDEKPRTLVNAYQEQEDFVARSKAAEKAKENKKSQDAIKKQLEDFIANGIVFVDGLRGVIDHSKNNKVKEACAKHLANGIAANRDLAQVGKEIRDFVAGEHEKAEKALERVQ
jgi:hypothetical protein